jgi:hypothetical protein
MVKNGGGGGLAQQSPLSLSPPPSEFCNDENNSVIRSAMDALRNSKKITLLNCNGGFSFYLHLSIWMPLVHNGGQVKSSESSKLFNYRTNGKNGQKENFI